MKKIIFMLVMASSITMYAEEIKEIATQENEKPTESNCTLCSVATCILWCKESNGERYQHEGDGFYQ